MKELIKHSFEAGRRGKPDEFETNLALYLTGTFLEIDPNARFDLRVHGTYDEKKDIPIINISGEVSRSLTECKPLIEKEVNYWYKETYRNDDEIKVNINLKGQSTTLNENINSGDSGNPIAVAYKNTPSFLPWERFLTVKIRDLIDDAYRRNGSAFSRDLCGDSYESLAGLRADGKVQVSALYDRHELVRISDIVISCEHEKYLSLDSLNYNITEIVRNVLKHYKIPGHNGLVKPNIVVNPNGSWHEGGLKVDDGNREAKPYRDGFSTYGVNEDSFSGEDPSKPSATGTFLAKWIADYVCKNDLAEFARVSLCYQIGNNDVDLNIWTNGTGKKNQYAIEQIVKKEVAFDIRSTIRKFDLLNPKLYKGLARDSDFFQNPALPWNYGEK